MSVTAVGPALAIDGPLPVSPPYRLLSIPGVVVGDGDRWMNGVNVDGYPSDTPSLWEPCSTGTFRTKVEGGALPQPRFDAFVIYEPITCSTLGMGDPGSFAERARVVLEATESFGVEEALSQGITLSTNPFFGDANLDILAGGRRRLPRLGCATWKMQLVRPADKVSSMPPRRQLPPGNSRPWNQGHTSKLPTGHRSPPAEATSGPTPCSGLLPPQARRGLSPLAPCRFASPR